MKKKLERLYDIIKKIPKEERPRLLIISNEQILRCYKGALELHTFIKPHGIVTHIGLNRGQILEIFSKIEFIVNEIIAMHINAANNEHIDDLLTNLDLFTKIKLLNQWGIISDSFKEKMICIKEVRNGFAHYWSTGEVRYKNRPIEINFSIFKKDLIQTWVYLILKHKSTQPKINKLEERLQFLYESTVASQ